MLGKILILLIAVLLGVVVFVYSAFRSDMEAAYDRIRAEGQVVASPYGDIEFTERGTGYPVLVIHGSGGGYDQGQLIADAVLDGPFRTITPSRFGYLRSTFRAGATWDDQAHAYASLLDRLGIDRVAVVAMSHGGPSALLFAILHPERTSSLTLLSCGVVTAPSIDQSEADRKGEVLTAVYQSDLLYWLASKALRRQFMQLIGATEATIDRLNDSQRDLVNSLIDYMNPASPRSAGVVFDNTATLPGERIASIRAPTLVVHARDDTLQLFHNARFAAATIPGAELLSYEHGGHVLIAVEQAEISEAVRAHVLSGTAPAAD
jgi:pimeloyl-ACP methyl ester carboxylesterase